MVDRKRRPKVSGDVTMEVRKGKKKLAQTIPATEVIRRLLKKKGLFGQYKTKLVGNEPFSDGATPEKERPVLVKKKAKSIIVSIPNGEGRFNESILIPPKSRKVNVVWDALSEAFEVAEPAPDDGAAPPPPDLNPDEGKGGKDAGDPADGPAPSKKKPTPRDTLRGWILEEGIAAELLEAWRAAANDQHALPKEKALNLIRDLSGYTKKLRQGLGKVLRFLRDNGYVVVDGDTVTLTEKGQGYPERYMENGEEPFPSSVHRAPPQEEACPRDQVRRSGAGPLRPPGLPSPSRPRRGP